VELLVVIVVIGILAAIAIPVFLSQADKASDTALKSDLTNAAKLLQVAEANGENLPSEFAAGDVVDLGTAGTFSASETLTVTGSGETLCIEGTSASGNVFSVDLDAGIRNYDCNGYEGGWQPLQATGGDSVYDITDDGVTYRVHEFTAVGAVTFTVTDAGSLGDIEYLVVAGGGGGGGASAGYGAGGGGAGGVLSSATSEPLEVTAQEYTIQVGAGGAGGISGASGVQSPTRGENGGDSSIGNEIVAVGGGGGGRGQNTERDGLPGGSGGGAASLYNHENPGTVMAQGGTGTPGQGFAGGTGIRGDGVSAWLAGGGGGAGGVGSNGVYSPTRQLSPGGVGVISTITGELGIYASGGDGGYWQVGEGIDGSAGEDGTGNGGDGASTAGSWRAGHSGGSGIVIVRYPLTAP